MLSKRQRSTSQADSLAMQRAYIARRQAREAEHGRQPRRIGFFDLSRELRDEIYRYAVGPEGSTPQAGTAEGTAAQGATAQGAAAQDGSTQGGAAQGGANQSGNDQSGNDQSGSTPNGTAPGGRINGASAPLPVTISINDARSTPHLPNFALVRTCRQIHAETAANVANFYSSNIFRVDILSSQAVVPHGDKFVLAPLERPGDNFKRKASVSRSELTRPRLLQQLRKVSPEHLKRIRNWEFAYHPALWLSYQYNLQIPNQRIVFPEVPQSTLELTLTPEQPFFSLNGTWWNDWDQTRPPEQSLAGFIGLCNRFDWNCKAEIEHRKLRSLAPRDVMGLAYCVQHIADSYGPSIVQIEEPRRKRKKSKRFVPAML